MVGIDRFVQPALLHQGVAQESVIENERSPGYEFARDRFRILETMERMIDVAAQQLGIRRARDL